jgi:ribonuclease D
MHKSVPFIATPEALAAFCQSLRGARCIAIDTEFVGENTYFPKLEIVQIAAEGAVAVIDAPAVADLGPLLEVLFDPAAEKILHAATQDLEIFYAMARHPLVPIFDTQIAAAFLGYGESVSYSALVERVTGRRLRKLHTTTDWSRRPLSPAQLAYAAEDVMYLLPVHRHLTARLKVLGRLDWVREECRALEGVPAKVLVEDTDRFRRVKDRHRLTPRELAVLRELAAWRESTSRHRNLPRFRVLPDDLLVEIARLAPTRAADLRHLRRLSPRCVERDGESIVQAVRRGLEVPDADLPQAERGRPLRVHAGIVELLHALLRARADERRIASSLLATVRDLELLAHDPNGKEALALPILSGWRREMVGDDLLEILSGRAAIRVDARDGRIVLEGPAGAHAKSSG